MYQLDASFDRRFVTARIEEGGRQSARSGRSVDRKQDLFRIKQYF